MAIAARLACVFALSSLYLAFAAKPFLSWWIVTTDFQVWATAFQALSNSSLAIALDAVPLIVLLLLCLAAATVTTAAVFDTISGMTRDISRAIARVQARSSAHR